MSTFSRSASLVGVLTVSSIFALAGPPAAAVHVRGTIQSVKGNVMTILSSTGPVRVQLPTKLAVIAVIPSDRTQIKDGAFVGIASIPGAGGAQTAREVVVFPEFARGAGEGSYDWDLPETGTGSHSRMTNGTVAHATSAGGAASKSRMTNGSVSKSNEGALTVTYKDGSKTGSQMISLPPNIPIVTFVPGAASQLKPGAHVFVVGHGPAGAVSADRIMVGKDGLVPPM